MKDIEYVRKNSKNQLVFPKNIPHARSHLAFYIKYVFGLVSFLVAICIHPSLQFIVKALSSTLLILFFITFMTRLAHFVEEYHYLHCRYDNKIRNLFNNIFVIHTFQLVVFCTALLGFFSTEWEPLIKSHVRCSVFLIIGLCLSKDIFHLNDYPLCDSLRIAEMKGLDYGSGMAHSYYHGFLRIILHSDDGLREKMETYENNNGIKFKRYSLFILVPQSMYCPNSMENDFSPSIEKASTLDPIVLNRAGVIKRPYLNAVYKINYNLPNGKRDKIYMCTEYATPLKTLYEVVTKTGLHSADYAKYKKELTYQFYITLTTLIEQDPEMCNLCEVIYYNDKNSNGDFIDVGKLIIKKIILDDKKKTK